MVQPRARVDLLHLIAGRNWPARFCPLTKWLAKFRSRSGAPYSKPRGHHVSSFGFAKTDVLAARALVTCSGLSSAIFSFYVLKFGKIFRSWNKYGRPFYGSCAKAGQCFVGHFEPECLDSWLNPGFFRNIQEFQAVRACKVCDRTDTSFTP